MTVKVLAFDVNETLLDLRGLDGAFEEVLGDPSLRGQWFAQMLQLSFVGGLTGEYLDFTSAQRAAFLMIARRVGVSVSDQDAEKMVDRMSALSPHTEVSTALSRLKDTSLKVVALTNSVKAVAEAQLKFAGIRDLFDDVLSADTVHMLKPSPEPYHHVAATCDVDIDQVRLIAAHAWDISGALAAGCKAGFVQRPGMVLSPVGRQPDIIGEDLDQVINQSLEVDLPVGVGSFDTRTPAKRLIRRNNSAAQPFSGCGSVAPGWPRRPCRWSGSGSGRRGCREAAWSAWPSLHRCARAWS